MSAVSVFYNLNLDRIEDLKKFHELVTEKSKPDFTWGFRCLKIDDYEGTILIRYVANRIVSWAQRHKIEPQFTTEQCYLGLKIVKHLRDNLYPELDRLSGDGLISRTFDWFINYELPWDQPRECIDSETYLIKTFLKIPQNDIHVADQLPMAQREYVQVSEEQLEEVYTSSLV